MANRARTDRPMVLVVDDIPPVIRLLALELGVQGFEVTGCQVYEAVERVRLLKPDLVLLEAILPGIDAFDLMAQLKQETTVPIVFLTTSALEADRAQAYELGAADYITKPFDPEELDLRIAALLGVRDLPHPIIQSGDLQIDVNRQLVRRGSALISLTTNEWAILLALVSGEGRPVSMAELFSTVWGQVPLPATALMPTIDSLRSKLEDDPSMPRLIVGDPEKGFSIRMAKRN